MKLSQKSKNFIDFLLDSWNQHETLSISEKKDETHSLSIFPIIDSERSGYLII